MKPSGADYDNFKSARDKKGSAEVTDAATTREHAFTDVAVKNLVRGRPVPHCALSRPNSAPTDAHAKS